MPGGPVTWLDAAEPERSSGAYHLPSDACHQSAPCARSLIDRLSRTRPCAESSAWWCGDLSVITLSGAK